jgi:FeS assembly SUF system protein
MHPGDKLFLEQRIHEALRTCFDPELPINVYDLGLIYDVDVDDDGAVHIKMTLTSRDCPVAGSLPGEVERKVGDVEGVASSRVELVWDPPWHPNRISEPAKHQLGLID